MVSNAVWDPEATPPAVGDIVLIHDDKPRGFWKLGRVEEIIVGRDGHIRGAVLEVYCTTITRTLSAAEIQISKPMEETVTESMESATLHTEGVNDEVPKRPMRASA